MPNRQGVSKGNAADTGRERTEKAEEVGPQLLAFAALDSQQVLLSPHIPSGQGTRCVCTQMGLYLEQMDVCLGGESPAGRPRLGGSSISLSSHISRAAVMTVPSSEGGAG